MVKIIPSPLVANVSGSVGGTTFARGRNGLTARAKRKRFVSNSPLQINQNGNFTKGINRWRDELTEAQRQAWNAYARLFPSTNALGQRKNRTGYHLFLERQLIFDNPKNLISGTELPADPPAESASVSPLRFIMPSYAGEAGIIGATIQWYPPTLLNVSLSIAKPSLHSRRSAPRTFNVSPLAISFQPQNLFLIFTLQLQNPSDLSDRFLWIKFRAISAENVPDRVYQTELRFTPF